MNTFRIPLNVPTKTTIPPRLLPGTHPAQTPGRELRRDAHQQSSWQEGLSVDEQTGHLYVDAPGLELRFPMVAVRHGQTDGNVNEKFQGQINGPEYALNALGQQQVQDGARRLSEQLHDLFAERLSAYLEAGKVVLLRSPLVRVQQTTRAFTEHIRQRTGIALEATVEPRLIEMSFGLMEGHALHTTEDPELQVIARQYRAENALINWKNTGERFLDVLARGAALLDELNIRYAGQGVLVVAFSHGITINALRILLGDPALLEPDGRVAFRKHILENAEAYWLGHSRQLAERLFGLSHLREPLDRAAQTHRIGV